jgi:hypothetical protein
MLPPTSGPSAQRALHGSSVLHTASPEDCVCDNLIAKHPQSIHLLTMHQRRARCTVASQQPYRTPLQQA